MSRIHVSLDSKGSFQGSRFLHEGLGCRVFG